MKKIKNKKVKVNITIDPSLKKEGQQEASKRDLSLSQLLAIGLKRELLKNYGK